MDKEKRLQLTSEGMQPFVKKRCNKLRKEIEKIGWYKLEILSPRERELIEFRLQGDTFEQVGAKLQMHRQNVLKSQKRALEKMQKAEELEKFMW
jgi:DNA-directed RNA polymerase sigma subunit (sigma70/sigma32)